MEVIEELEDMFFVSVFFNTYCIELILNLNRLRSSISFKGTIGIPPEGSFSIGMGYPKENIKLWRKLRSRLFQV
jgi:hypothetical protein